MTSGHLTRPAGSAASPAGPAADGGAPPRLPFLTAVGSQVAGRALDSELGATGPAVVGASFAVLPLIPTIAIASLQRRSLSGGSP